MIRALRLELIVMAALAVSTVATSAQPTCGSRNNRCTTVAENTAERCREACGKARGCVRKCARDFRGAMNACEASYLHCKKKGGVD